MPIMVVSRKRSWSCPKRSLDYALASLYQSQSRCGEAERLYQRALAIREQTFERTHPSIARNLNNLASLYKEQGRYTEAEALLQRALAIAEQTFGATHPVVAVSFNNLANVYRDQGR